MSFYEFCGVLQKREFQRLGGTRMLKTDARAKTELERANAAARISEKRLALTAKASGSGRKL